MPVSQLPPEEIARRIKAARQLRDVSQAELAEAFERDGLNKHDLGKIERCDRVMQRAHQDALVRHLAIPERWLTEPDVDVIVGFQGEDEQRTALAELTAGLKRLTETLENQDLKREIQQAFEDYARRLGPEIGKLPPRSRRSQGHPAEDPPAAA